MDHNGPLEQLPTWMLRNQLAMLMKAALGTSTVPSLKKQFRSIQDCWKSFARFSRKGSAMHVAGSPAAKVQKTGCAHACRIQQNRIE